jgi:hypothetical protein
MSNSKLLCNLSTKSLFRLTDNENDTRVYPQIWRRTVIFLRREGKKKYECYQVNGEKYISFIPGSNRVFPLSEAEAEEILAAMREAAEEKEKEATT